MHVVDAAAENPIGDYRTVREVCFLLATKLNSWSTQICTSLSEKRKKKKRKERQLIGPLHNWPHWVVHVLYAIELD